MQLPTTVGELESMLERKNAHLVRLNRYYDDAPDGSYAKRDAIATINRIQDERVQIEKALDSAYEEMKL